MLFECDGRPAQIEIGIGQKLGEYSLTFSLQAGLVQGVTRATAARVLVVLLLEYSRRDRVIVAEPSVISRKSACRWAVWTAPSEHAPIRAIVVQEQYL